MVPTREGSGQSTGSRPITLAAVSVTASPAWLAPEHQEAAEEALAVLTDASLNPIVDMVLSACDGVYTVRSHDGEVRFRRNDGGATDGVATEGSNPLADQATDKFSPLAAEVAHPHPSRRDNAYPHAF